MDANTKANQEDLLARMEAKIDSNREAVRQEMMNAKKRSKCRLITHVTNNGQSRNRPREWTPLRQRRTQT
jgi:hypothetical protein